VLSMAARLPEQNCGRSITSAYPGPSEGLYLAVADPVDPALNAETDGRMSTRTWS
jgi:hypothetical protein